MASVMSHCTTHSFEIICRGWKAGFADHNDMMCSIYEKVQVGKDQEKAQSEKDPHSKNRGGKKPN